MTLRQARILFSSMLIDLGVWAREQGYVLAFDMLRRCQDCKVGKQYSKHKEGLAVDLIMYVDLDGDGDHETYQRDTGAYRRIGIKWESLHPWCRWGGRWSDGNHLEFVTGGWR